MTKLAIVLGLYVEIDIGSIEKKGNSFYILKTIENATGASVAFLIKISVIHFSIYL